MTDIEKIVKIIENYSPELAAEEILRLFSVVGQSELLVCEYCKDDAKPTCCDSCLEGMVNAVQKAN